MIEIKNLTKVYKLSSKMKKELKTNDDKKIAVNNLSLSIKDGEVFGLLGTNGAGKTTTLRIIATLLKPTEGSVEVSGFDTVIEGDKVRKEIGFLTSEIKLDPNFSPDYLYDFFRELRSIPKDVATNQKEKLFKYFDIENFKDKKVEELSTGMNQKAAIAISLMHNPNIVIFDEPTSGLDIVTARSVLDYIKLLKEQNKTVIMSTHNMSEAEKVCDRIGIIIDGKLVFVGTLSEVKEKTKTKDLEEAFLPYILKIKESYNAAFNNTKKKNYPEFFQIEKWFLEFL